MSADRVAVLFTDMEGSTELSSDRGDEVALELLRVHETLVRKAAAGRDGRVVKSTGDGYLVAFSTGFDAVAAALEIRNALGAHNDDHPDERVLVRFGINVGPAIEQSGDLFGLAVNAGARIAAKAMTGQVLVSSAVVDELGAAPGWSVLDRGLFWLKGLREQWRLFEVTDGVPVGLGTAVDSRLAFVGREAQRGTLRRIVDDAIEGRGGLTFVAGTSGSGKTRLVEEVGREAEARGLQYLAARCYGPGAQTPYGPIVELLGVMQRRFSPQAFRAVLGDGAPEIARIAPQLRAPDLGEPREWPVQEARHALFVALRDALARCAAGRPLVLLIDDLHWADEATLHLLEYLASETRRLAIAMFAVYAEDEVAANDQFRPFLATVHRKRDALTVTVPPLGEADVAALLRAVGAGEPPAPLVARLREATGGNAFFVDELVRHLLDQALLLDERGEWAAAASSTAIAGHVPDTIRYTIEQRLDRVSEQTRSVLTTAAVIGRDFGFELLDELADGDEDSLLDALDEAERARLVVSETDGDIVRFTFAHGLIQAILAGNVSLTRRQRLHLRVADALEAIYADSPADHASEVAFHLTNAGRWAPRGRAIRALVQAGDHAIGASAYEEALRHFDRALALLGDAEPRSRASMLEKLGLAERSLGHLDDALAAWNEALAIHEEDGASHEVARLCLMAAIQVAWWRRGRDVIALVERGLAALGEHESPLRGGLLALAGGVASQSGSYDQASRLLDEALAIARRHGDDAILGLALYSLAVHHFSHYQYENVVTAGRASLGHLRAAGDLWNLANVQGYVGASLGWLGRFEEADATGRDAEELALRLGNWSAYVFAEGARAFLEIGRAAPAEATARRGVRALDLGRELGFDWLTSIGHARLGLAAFWDGRWEEALELLGEAARGERRTASGGHLGRLFLLHAYLGNREDSLALIDEARASFPVVGRPNSGTSWTLALAAVEALALLGERNRAASLYPIVVDHAATGTLMRSWDYRLVSTLAGIAAGCDDRWDLASQHFAHARQLAVSLPMRHELPDALRFEALALIERGDSDGRARAGALLRDAASAYDELGMQRHAAMTVRLLEKTETRGRSSAR